MTAMPLDPVNPVNQASRPKSSEEWRIMFRYFRSWLFLKAIPVPLHALSEGKSQHN
jgi:hypothetical protein